MREKLLPLLFLVCLFLFCWLVLACDVFLLRSKFFLKKINRLWIALITSFTILLNSILVYIVRFIKVKSILSDVLLNNKNDPDESIFNNLSQIDSVFCTVEETTTSFKKFNDKTFSVLHMNVRSLNQKFEFPKELLTSIKFEFKVICLTETWCTDNPRNETLFSLKNCTSINQVRKHGRWGCICVFIQNFDI